jgi:ubiquinone/menaquinone biosynthesis C-methylase UbiE
VRRDIRDVEEHYAGLAEAYDENWAYSPAYVRWMSAQISKALELTPSDRVADVGCGTGLFTREIAQALRPQSPVLCVDPSAAMLKQLPASPDLKPVQASLEDLAGQSADPPPLDAVVVKEAIHHAPDRAAAVSGLARLLAPAGRLLIVMLPTTIEYPLFDAALRRFEELQPNPDNIAGHMTAAGLQTRVWQVEYEIRLPAERYLGMVRSRYMSLLSMFSEQEIEEGIREIRGRHPQPELVFPDRFVFLLGRKDGALPGAAAGERLGGIQ